jgi:DNA-binding response OmpR family regulator
MHKFENLKLALVEDNEDARLVMTYLLEKRGFDVCQFADGESAAIGIPKFRPNVAVIDLGLPGKSGYELAEEIRRNDDLKHIILIALSGYGQEEDQIKSAAAGFDEHAVKPTQADTLCELIASHLISKKKP